jgi:hypothetical protein
MQYYLWLYYLWHNFIEILAGENVSHFDYCSFLCIELRSYNHQCSLRNSEHSQPENCIKL